jgi:hypothetical protein
MLDSRPTARVSGLGGRAWNLLRAFFTSEMTMPDLRQALIKLLYTEWLAEEWDTMLDQIGDMSADVALPFIDCCENKAVAAGSDIPMLTRRGAPPGSVPKPRQFVTPTRERENFEGSSDGYDSDVSWTTNDFDSDHGLRSTKAKEKFLKKRKAGPRRRPSPPPSVYAKMW